VVLRNTLLSIHILAVVVWLGCGLYELLLTREIRRAHGAPEEIPLLRIYGRYAGIVAIATLFTAAAGALMSIMLGWGFFSVLWLGIKQGIMVAIILAMIFLTPLFMKTYAAISAVSDSDSTSLQIARDLIARVERYVLLMRFGGVISVLLAVWRPTI
jgi:ABC-type multidrug transport system permease subunit